MNRWIPNEDQPMEPDEWETLLFDYDWWDESED